MNTRNQAVVRVMQLTKEKQDILNSPCLPQLDEYSAACEEEATIHYIDEEIASLSVQFGLT